AESSLTISGIKYVINSGHELKSQFDAEHRARKLDRQFASKAQQAQRCGRTGRTAPGICFNLFTKDDYENKMTAYPESEIKSSNITDECLNLISLEKIQTVPKLIETLANFIEPPKELNIRVAVNNLIQLGLIEKDTITSLGKLINEIPANDVMISLSIFYG